MVGADGHIKLADFGLSEEGVGVEVSSSEEDTLALDEFRDSLDEVPVRLHPTSARLNQLPEDISDGGGIILRHPILQSITNDEDTSSVSSCCSTSSIESPMIHAPGTPDYISPEIILGRPHGAPVDFWAMGVIMYELLVGEAPFNDLTVEAIFSNILDFKIQWPEEGILSPNAMHLMQNLLRPNPSDRLTITEIMNHPFFQDIKWDSVRDTPPPFIPTLSDLDDTSYFNHRELTEMFLEVNDQKIDLETQGMANEFSSFRYTNMNALADAMRTDAQEMTTTTCGSPCEPVQL